MHKPSRMVPFIFGLVMGILCTIYLPGYVRPYLPDALVGKDIVVKGTVAAKEKKGEDLLLTVSTPEGALLATFKKKAAEVNLLINEKDEVQFVLPKYMPFIEDPKIIRVVKEQQAVPASVEAAAAPARREGKNTQEMKPRKQMRPQTAVPTPVPGTDVKPSGGGSNTFPADNKKAVQ
jgi:hypothetical protein